MRVLWFTNSSVDYQEHITGYNGGGWMTSLKNVLDKEKDIELGISFLLEDTEFKKKINGTTYYPVSHQSGILDKVISKLKYGNNLNKRFRNSDEQYVKKFVDVINDFKPSVIHIWGTEKNFGLICEHTKIPVIIHLQGIINPYLNAFFPPNISLKDFIIKDGLNPFSISKNRKEYNGWKYIADREKKIFRNCKYFMGRTDWDRILTEIYSKDATYFHCEEALRDEFYTALKWKPQKSNKAKIVTTISGPLYKGGDLLLKVANLLKKELDLDFEWEVYGIDNLQVQEKLIGINTSDVNLVLKGMGTSEQIRLALQTANVFVHPSYIDNSPNSVCEAQICGVPVVACNVGGMSTLIKNNVTGVVVPANDPYTMAYSIKEICTKDAIAEKISTEAVKAANKRHNRDEIVMNLISIYKILYDSQNS
ncbi:glycosyltransferase [Flavobacterium limi]|uniref:Glycosyl transferase n=1 Tax=Flavobacterium limi TaxID=2045105 RepID=A0ABQ1U9U4_9FLAO|nr:glycosyltransferase [Flavobacterium limi]GGF12611.1 glycosyl transferase [Flavobacterium limi]